CRRVTGSRRSRLASPPWPRERPGRGWWSITGQAPLTDHWNGLVTPRKNSDPLRHVRCECHAARWPTVGRALAANHCRGGDGERSWRTAPVLGRAWNAPGVPDLVPGLPPRARSPGKDAAETSRSRSGGRPLPRAWLARVPAGRRRYRAHISSRRAAEAAAYRG